LIGQPSALIVESRSFGARWHSFNKVRLRPSRPDQDTSNGTSQFRG